MFATKLSEGHYRVTHCAAGRKTVYHIDAVDAFSAIMQLLTQTSRLASLTA